MGNILNFSVGGGLISALHVLFNIGLTFLLTLLISWVYRRTHKGLSYSQSFVFTLILMSIIVNVVMMIIGNNLARAFGLLGAFAIIRFRTAVKETRDTGFIFFVLSIGMAVGTNNYSIAIVSTLVICLIIWILYKTNFGSLHKNEYLLSFEFSHEQNTQESFVDIFKEFFKDTMLLNIHSKQDGKVSEMVYHVNFIDDTKQSDLVKSLSSVVGVAKVHLIASKSDIEY